VQRESGQDAPWFDNDPADAVSWDFRVPIRIANFSDEAIERRLVVANLSPFLTRLHGRALADSLRIVDEGQVLDHSLIDDLTLFETGVPARSIKTCYAYFSEHRVASTNPQTGFLSILQSPANLAKNPDFKDGDRLPSDWEGGAEGTQPDGTTYGFGEGLFGARCARYSVPEASKPTWVGWRQDVPVLAGQTYLYGAWVRSENLTGPANLYAHYRDANGDQCGNSYAQIAVDSAATTEWTPAFGVFGMPADIANFQIHLTMNTTGTLMHDGVVLMATTAGTCGMLESNRALDPQADVASWQVNAIRKVFQDDPPPRTAPQPVTISLAANEKEPLQIALRTRTDVKGLQIEVEAPTNAEGAALEIDSIGMVGYVPVDAASGYQTISTVPWRRVIPGGGSGGALPSDFGSGTDGWGGLWPDPILPGNKLDLSANQTQPLWITFRAAAGTTPGNYHGKVRLTRAGATFLEIPFQAHVWGFELPDHPGIGAVYDVTQREASALYKNSDLSPQEHQKAVWRTMAENGLNPDRVYPSPIFSHQGGEAKVDFKAFDEMASFYFDELGFTHSYTPWEFYSFGWGNLPYAYFGEQPYESSVPGEIADRAKLRPEYKKIYQDYLRAFWDHVKEKGWADRFILYVSDEPFFHETEIIKQMQAVCDMIHEVDPAIPVFSSTWNHIPEWEGYLDVWGIGHFGLVSPETMARLRANGDRLYFTTDGHMCIDTPYLAIERMLPHYAFHFDAEAYEFWRLAWYTYNPFDFAWHKPNINHTAPGETSAVRFPNGDGYLVYPGHHVGVEGPVPSIRFEAAREGVEDYTYLRLLKEAITRAGAEGRNTTQAQAALSVAEALIVFPNPGGRFSTKFLPDPDALMDVRQELAKGIESLQIR
jgi:hypothetical protein